MPFTTETARKAGKKSRRGKAKISITMREFVFAVLKENIVERLNLLKPEGELKIYEARGENYKLEFFGNLNSQYRLVIE